MPTLYADSAGKWERTLDHSFVTLLVCAELGLLLVHVVMFIYYYSAKLGVRVILRTVYPATMWRWQGAEARCVAGLCVR